MILLYILYQWFRSKILKIIIIIVMSPRRAFIFNFNIMFVAGGEYFSKTSYILGGGSFYGSGVTNVIECCRNRNRAALVGRKLSVYDIKLRL